MSNTKKMNELEELGRVDAEKAWTKKGKKNLKSEKKRVVSDIKKASTGAHVSTRGFGAARTSGMGLQDEKLKPGQNYEILKGGDYIKDLI